MAYYTLFVGGGSVAPLSPARPLRLVAGISPEFRCHQAPPPRPPSCPAGALATAVFPDVESFPYCCLVAVPTISGSLLFALLLVLLGVLLGPSGVKRGLWCETTELG